ncbi:MAG: DUF2934 domain-containing protein [Terriglobales bacterium]
MRKPTTTKAPVPETQEDLVELIRARAYQLYEQRGRVHGYDLQDWLMAEAEVREFQAHKAAA